MIFNSKMMPGIIFKFTKKSTHRPCNCDPGAGNCNTFNLKEQPIVLEGNFV
ncbi:hypothetical protein N824_13110 [Pedobacter sp. V48]|nr:hypothetical protein N824_13110 [Pedobacter sp. V48]